MTDHLSETHQLTTWPNRPPQDCPFRQSALFKGLKFTGRYATYLASSPWWADFFMPAWASDGNLYCGCGDGNVGGKDVHAGLVKICGADPLRLQFELLGDLSLRTPGQMFNCTNIIVDGRWYVGLEEGWNWSSAAGMGRFWGFVHTATPEVKVGALGYPFARENSSWTDATVPNPARMWWDKYRNDPNMQARLLPIGRPGFPSNMPLERPGGFFADIPYNSRFRGPHFVDLGQDGKRSNKEMVYMTAHGSFGARPSEWGNGDAIYLLRAPATLTGITMPEHWEGYMGVDPSGQPLWTANLTNIAPIAIWRGKLGRCAMTWNVALSRYILCVAPLVRRDTDDPDHPKEHSAEGVLILESASMTGPWNLIHFLEDFGPNAYCLNIPSKFIGEDGRTFWLLYSARWGVDKAVPSNPPGSAYGACFCEVELDA